MSVVILALSCHRLDTPDAEPPVGGKTSIVIGAAARVAPVYEGSKTTKVSPFPYIDIHGLFHGARDFFKLHHCRDARPCGQCRSVRPHLDGRVAAFAAFDARRNGGVEFVTKFPNGVMSGSGADCDAADTACSIDSLAQIKDGACHGD
jgi:hypothetical protein